MKLPIFSTLAFTDFCFAAVLARSQDSNSTPAAFFLAGDSTTAIINAAKTGGGWGDGFLGTLKNSAIGFNYGHNGATTVSFRNGGDWARVLAGVAGNKTNYNPFVTIQFGHNDQKATANITVEQYSANLEQFGKDVRNAGGEPIFVTPLSRRAFNSSGLVIENLAVQAAATRAVAQSLNAWLVDLNKYSTEFLNSVGAQNATLYNLTPTDFTHLDVLGQTVFGNMVSWLLVNEKNGRFQKWTSPQHALASQFNALP